MSIIVAKFGGTSMGSARSLLKVVDIIISNPNRQVVVVSALSGVTDRLIDLGQIASKGGDWGREFSDLIERHEEVLAELDISLSLENFYRQIKNLLQGVTAIGEFSARSQDHLQSFGERISSYILTELLGQKTEVLLVNSSELIKTDSNFLEANINFTTTTNAITQNVKRYLHTGRVLVCAGFVGVNNDGEYTTLGRGGSDYSAAILANVLDVDELEIWTDVDGIMTADPKIIPGAGVITQMSYGEAAELAYFGAKVLHPKTIRPAIEKNIPVKVLNTFNQKSKGTMVTSQSSTLIKSVACKKGVTVLNICSARMLEASGFLNKIFLLFDKYNISIDVISTSEVSVSLTIEQDPPKELLESLEEFSKVESMGERAIICLVGEKIKGSRGVLTRLFMAVDGVPVEMISQGASQRNVTLVVQEGLVEGVVKKIYNNFFNSN
jgi:aspartate kinase